MAGSYDGFVGLSNIVRIPQHGQKVISESCTQMEMSLVNEDVRLRTVYGQESMNVVIIGICCSAFS